MADTCTCNPSSTPPEHEPVLTLPVGGDRAERGNPVLSAPDESQAAIFGARGAGGLAVPDRSPGPVSMPVSCVGLSDAGAVR